MHSLAFLHIRLWTSVVTGALIAFALPGHWAVVIRMLIGWNCGVELFLILIYAWMVPLKAPQISDRFKEADESASIILVVVVAAALLSLIAIVMVLSSIKQLSPHERMASTVLAALTIVNSWLLVPTTFTPHYADMFYSVESDKRPLTFPKTPMPEFWDFAYFSFTIAAACQTSDVATNEIAIRKAVIAHTLISFVFNTSILGFAINVSAGLIGGN